MLPSTAFVRVNAATLGILGDISYQLGFGQDAEGRAQITGWLKFEVMLECWRCQGRFVFKVDAPLSMYLVATEAEADVLEDEHREVMVLADATIKLLDILEDEALLSLPPFPRHAPDECQPELMQQLAIFAPRHEVKHPFAVLEALKKH